MASLKICRCFALCSFIRDDFQLLFRNNSRIASAIKIFKNYSHVIPASIILTRYAIPYKAMFIKNTDLPQVAIMYTSNRLLTVS